MGVKVRWVPLWGQYLVQISVDGDTFLTLAPETAWELVHATAAVLITKPVAGTDNR